MKNISWMLLLGGCVGGYAGLCDDAVALEDQQACVADVADQARLDLDARVRVELDRAAIEDARDGVRDQASACREAIDALAADARAALARLDRPAARREVVGAALDDLTALLRRCTDDLRDASDGEPVRDEADARDETDARDESSETRPTRRP